MKVYIYDKVYIPGIGMGPFFSPVEVDDIRLIQTIKAISGNYRFILDGENSTTPVVKSEPVNLHVDPEEIINTPVEKTEEKAEPVILNEETTKEEDIPKENIAIVDPELKAEIEKEIQEAENKEIISEEELHEEIAEKKILSEEELNLLTVSQLKELLTDEEIQFLANDKKDVLIKKYIESNK